jgi:hypothetical protein
MKSNIINKIARTYTLLNVLVFTAISTANSFAQSEVIEVSFKDLKQEANSDKNDLTDIVKLCNVSEAYSKGGLNLLTHNGDMEDLFIQENQNLIENPFYDHTWRFCSIFSTKTKDEVIARCVTNWNNIVCSLFTRNIRIISISLSNLGENKSYKTI